LRHRIELVGPGRYRIARSAVDAIVSQYARLLSGVRFRPAVESGRVTGMRVSRVPKRSLLGQLGLRNGDQLQSINGLSLTGPKRALDAYARLRTADEWRVLIERKGKPVSLEYRIQ
jgi:general secretion pathway protein C